MTVLGATLNNLEWILSATTTFVIKRDFFQKARDFDTFGLYNLNDPV